MKLNHGLHLAYCTNIHRGETWPETLDSLNKYTLAVRARVPKPAVRHWSPAQPTRRSAVKRALGLLDFQRWLEQNDCYIFTINGFPYGQFHGDPRKGKVYLARLDFPGARRVYQFAV